MRCPHHSNEEDPTRDRMRDRANGTALQHAQDASTPRRRRKSKEQRDWAGPQEEDRHGEEQDEVLHHMDTKECGVIPLDNRLQCDKGEGERGDQCDATTTRDGIPWM